MTPAELFAPGVRQTPGTASQDDLPPHGPVTDLKRKDRCGLVAFEGRCDGKGVCLVQPSPGGPWTLRNWDALVAQGTLIRVLGIKGGDAWVSPDGEPWTVQMLCDAPGLDAIELLAAHEYHGVQLVAYKDVVDLLVSGWRPEASQ